MKTEPHPHPSAIIVILPCVRIERHEDHGQIDGDVIDLSALIIGRHPSKPFLIVNNGPVRPKWRTL